MRQKGSDGVGGYHRDEYPSLLSAYGGGWVAFNWLELLRPELHFILERG